MGILFYTLPTVWSSPLAKMAIMKMGFLVTAVLCLFLVPDSAVAKRPGGGKVGKHQVSAAAHAFVNELGGLKPTCDRCLRRCYLHVHAEVQHAAINQVNQVRRSTCEKLQSCEVQGRGNSGAERTRERKKIDKKLLEDGGVEKRAIERKRKELRRGSRL